MFVVLLPNFIVRPLQNLFKISFLEPQCTEYFEKVVDQFLEDRKSGEVRPCLHEEPPSDDSMITEVKFDESNLFHFQSRNDFLNMCVEKRVNLHDVSPESVRVTNGVAWSTEGVYPMRYYYSTFR